MTSCNTSSLSSFLSICSWNVGGLTSRTVNKLHDVNFIAELLPHDIVFLCETHTGYDTSISLDGFQHFPICRPISTNNRYYGGLALLIRKTIRNGVKILSNSSSEYQWIKLSKTFFHLEKDIFICFSYISPCFFNSKSDTDMLDAIFRDINKFKNDGHILLCGDLNARTGIDHDFISNDSDKHIPLDPLYLIDENIKPRNSQDTKVDERGKQIIDMCITSRMRILNGRSTGDCLGKYTCQKPNGASVVDYAILSEELLKDLIYFHVHQFQPLYSDCHSKVSLSIKASYKPQLSSGKGQKMPISFKWNKYSPEKFQKALKERDTVTKIDYFLQTQFDLDEKGIDSACNIFEDIVINVADKCLSRKKHKNKTNSQNKKWYDEELYLKRRELNQKANRMFNDPFNKFLRNSYYMCYRQYRKLVKYKKKNFTKLVMSQLDDLETKDPKAYWKLVNSLKNEDSQSDGPEKSVETEQWHDYFQTLNTVNDKFTERIKTIEEVLAAQNTRTFTLLDSVIKDKEILLSVSTLHNNNATGLDNIKMKC